MSRQERIGQLGTRNLAYFVCETVPITADIDHSGGDATARSCRSSNPRSFSNGPKPPARQPSSLIVRPGKGYGWGDFWRSTEDVTAFADWFDRSSPRDARD